MQDVLTLEDIKPFHAEYHEEKSSFERKDELVEQLANKYIRKLDSYYKYPIGEWKSHLQHDWMAYLDACRVERRVRWVFASILEKPSAEAAHVAQSYVCDEKLRNRIRDIISMIYDNYRRPYFVIDMFRTSKKSVEHVINDIRYLAKDEWRKAKIYIGTQEAERRYIMWIQDDSSQHEFRCIKKSDLRTNNAYIDVRYETNRVNRRGIVIDVRSCESSGITIDDDSLRPANVIVLRMSEEKVCDLLTILDSLLEKPYLVRVEIHLKKLSDSLRESTRSLTNKLKNSLLSVCRRTISAMPKPTIGVAVGILGIIVGILGLAATVFQYSC